MGILKNPDLPTSFQVPGVYIFQSRSGGAPDANNRRVLILGYRTSDGDVNKVGSPMRVNDEQEALSHAGTGSDPLRIYRSLISHMGGSGGGADIWFCTMNAPSGTAQARLIKIMAAPTNATTLGVNTTAQAAGVMSLYICGERADVTIATGDDFPTIAANLKLEIDKIIDKLPFTVGVSTDTITLTARNAALTSADSPIMVSFSSSAMLVAASPGTLTLATAAGADGTATLTVATQSASHSFLNGDAVNTIAGAFNAAIRNAAAFPVSSCCPTGAVITLFYANDRVVNWLATAITTAANTTITPAWGANAAGLPSSSTPSLATALQNIAAQPAFKCWITNFSGIGSVITASGITGAGSTQDLTNMGTLCSQLESQGNGQNQKGQVLHYGDTRRLTAMGTVAPGTSPALTTTQRFSTDWCAGGPQQAYEYAARCVADIMLTTAINHIIPYHGHVLRTDSRVPLLSQHPVVRPSDGDCNSAMVTYFATPIRDNGQGQLTIVSGRTTAKPSASMSGDYRWWPIALTDDFVRDDLGAYLAPFLRDKSIKAVGTPVTPYTTTASAVRVKVLDRIDYYNNNDFFDGGAAEWKDLCKAEINVMLPSRIDVKMPKKYPIPLEQLGVVTEFAG